MIASASAHRHRPAEGTDAVAAYLRQISRYPLLTREEEFVLARQAREGDATALETLVCSNLRFVVSVAKRYRHEGTSFIDLISEGNLGLIRAARRFDETRGFRLVSYAVWWIRQAVIHALEEQRAVHVPSGRALAIHRIERRTNALSHELGRAPTVEEIASELDLPADELRRTLALVRFPTSLDAPVSDDADGTLADMLEDERGSAPDTKLGNQQLADVLRKATDTLKPREADIIRRYFGLEGRKPQTLEEIGVSLRITRERVRQIRDRSLRQLRSASIMEALHV